MRVPVLESSSSPVACPRCHGKLAWTAVRVRCLNCESTYGIDAGIVDFAPGDHYDSFSPEDELSEEHWNGLRLEVDGSRRRITDFYAPLLRSKLPLARRVLDCGCGNGVSVETLLASGYDAWGQRLLGASRLAMAGSLHPPTPPHRHSPEVA